MKLLTLTIPGENGTPVSIQAPANVVSGQGGLQKIVNVGINFLVVGAIIVALFYLVLNGFRWITSGGDAKQIESARSGIMYSIVGLVIVIVSFFILDIIYTFFFGSGSLLQVPS